MDKPPPSLYEPDVAILTVLPQYELQALLRVFQLNFDEPSYIDASGILYWSRTLETTAEPRELRLLITYIDRAGTAPASSFAARLFAEFHPQLAILCGIAAGTPPPTKAEKKIALGDLVAADLVMGYEPGRLEPDGFKPRFLWLAPPYRLVRLLGYLAIVSRDSWITVYNKAQEELPLNERPLTSLTDSPRLHRATIASGDKLFADDTLPNLRKRYHEPIRAGEMEAVGFATAASTIGLPWLVIRGISDFGDPSTKDGREKDSFHATASNSAASFVRALLEKGGSQLIMKEPSHAPEGLNVQNRLERESLANRLLDLSRTLDLSLPTDRRRLYALADELAKEFSLPPDDLLLALNYSLEMDYTSGSSRNRVTVSLLALADGPAATFEDVLTGTEPTTDEELQLIIETSSRPGITASIDHSTSTSRRKPVHFQLPTLRRGNRLDFSYSYRWSAHPDTGKSHWQEFVADFLVAEFSLLAVSDLNLRLLGGTEESFRGEPRLLTVEEVTIKKAESGWHIRLLRPFFDRKYRVGFELTTDSV